MYNFYAYCFLCCVTVFMLRWWCGDLVTLSLCVVVSVLSTSFICSLICCFYDDRHCHRDGSKMICPTSDHFGSFWYHCMVPATMANDRQPVTSYLCYYKTSCSNCGCVSLGFWDVENKFFGLRDILVTYGGHLAMLPVGSTSSMGFPISIV